MEKKVMLTVLKVCIMAVVICGCDYKTALIEKPLLPIDSRLLGLWETTMDNQPTKITILALDREQYLVVYPSDSPDAMYARATFCDATEFALVQLTWIGSATTKADFSNACYQYAAFKLDGDNLEVRLLNPATAKPAATAAKLLANIKANSINPELFKSAMKLTRIKPPVDRKQKIERPPIPDGWN